MGIFDKMTYEEAIEVLKRVNPSSSDLKKAKKSLTKRRSKTKKSI